MRAYLPVTNVVGAIKFISYRIMGANWNIINNLKFQIMTYAHKLQMSDEIS